MQVLEVTEHVSEARLNELESWRRRDELRIGDCLAVITRLQRRGNDARLTWKVITGILAALVAVVTIADGLVQLLLHILK